MRARQSLGHQEWISRPYPLGKRNGDFSIGFNEMLSPELSVISIASEPVCGGGLEADHQKFPVFAV